MISISTEKIYDAIKKLCFIANTQLPESEYQKLLELYNNETNINSKNVLGQILENAQIAYQTRRPLCQDTGFVTVFLKIGQNISLKGENIKTIINQAVSDAYNEFFYRKSIVNNPMLDRTNTQNNTPVLIHTELTTDNEIEITLSIKGGGCENISAIKMLSPADGIEGIKNFVLETVKNANSKPCPPIKVGIGIGSNFEGAAILSKKALLNDKTQLSNHSKLEEELLNAINNLNIGAMGEGGISTCFGVKILDEPCHIASLPVAISISCHSSRYASAKINADKTTYCNREYEFKKIENFNNNTVEINTNEIEKIKNLNIGTHIQLTGKIYTARDAAHKRLHNLIKNNCELPINLKNAIIFYAGPCPKNDNEIIGPIGPTTSVRMDKYTPELYNLGLLATIGKGERNANVSTQISTAGGKYFTTTGGIASLLKKHVKTAKLIAFDDLGPEAIYELYVEKFPLKVQI